MGQYIPDLTERFPEGFGGIDLTDTFFGGSPRGGYINEDEYWDLKEEIPYEAEEKRPRKFEVGQQYEWVGWFTGGRSFYTVTERTPDRLVFSEYRFEIDGEYKLTESFKILTDENGDEYLKMCEYQGEEGRLYAEEV